MHANARVCGGVKICARTLLPRSASDRQNLVRRAPVCCFFCCARCARKYARECGSLRRCERLCAYFVVAERLRPAESSAPRPGLLFFLLRALRVKRCVRMRLAAVVWNFWCVFFKECNCRKCELPPGLRPAAAKMLKVLLSRDTFREGLGHEPRRRPRPGWDWLCYYGAY